MTGNSNLTSKNWKNEYFWSVEGQNQKMNSKFPVFLGSLAVKMKTLRESFRDRCKLTEWESLQVWASYVAMRARKKQKPSQFLVPASCCSNWLAACTQLLGSSPAWHPIFFFVFFGFSSFSQCVGAFFEFFFYQHRAKRAPCLPRKFDTAESLCQAVNRFFRLWDFWGADDQFFVYFCNLHDFLQLWIFFSDF